MITLPTTFVVGAGASTVYNLPTGSELKARAFAALNPDDDLSRLIRTALKMKYPSFNNDLANRHRLERFREELMSHPGDSIDEFLEDRRGELDVARVESRPSERLFSFRYWLPLVAAQHAIGLDDL